MSPALAGGFFTTEPPGKPSWSLFLPRPISLTLRPLPFLPWTPTTYCLSLTQHVSTPLLVACPRWPAPTPCLSRRFIVGSFP